MPHKTRKPNKHQSSHEQAAQGGILPMMINAVRGTLVAFMAGAVLLLIAAAIYGVGLWLTYRKAAQNYEKVDL